MRASRFTPEQKRDIVLTLLGGNVKMAELCREHQVSSTAIYGWRDQFLQSGLKGLQGNGASQREAALERENKELKDLIGDMAIVNWALKKGVRASMGNAGGRS